MNALKNRKFVFLVDITSYNVTNYNNIYTVVKLTEDESVVLELESKLELMVNNVLMFNIYIYFLFTYITFYIFPYYFLECSISVLKWSTPGIRWCRSKCSKGMLYSHINFYLYLIRSLVNLCFFNLRCHITNGWEFYSLNNW